MPSSDLNHFENFPALSKSKRKFLSKNQLFTLRLLFCGAALTFFSAPPKAFAETLHFSWPVNVGPLNPHLYTPNQLFAQKMVYETLVRYEKDGKIHPWLAKSWEVSPNGRNYLFHLRQDVRFSNGEMFNADAVKKNLEAVLHNRSRHSWLESSQQIQSVTVISPYEVKITLKDSYGSLLQDLALPRPFTFIAPSQFKNGGTEKGILSPIGTGPWKLVESKLGDADFFARNDSYWGKKPAFDTVEVKVIPDPNSRAIALETGRIDLIEAASGPISPDMFEHLQKTGHYRTALSEPVGTLALVLNTDKGATREKEVRQALNHAVDKEKILSAVLHNTQSRADTLLAENIPYANLNLKPYAYNPELAANMLEKAGWILPKNSNIRQKKGQKLSLELAFTSNDEIMKSMAEIIQADFKRIGVEIRLVGEEESSIFARQREGNFNLIFEDVLGAPFAPVAYFSSMRSPSHADYQAQLGLKDKKEIDSEIQKALLSTQEAERQALYKDILTRLHEEAVYLPLSHTTSVAVANKKIKKIVFGAYADEIPFEEMEPSEK